MLAVKVCLANSSGLRRRGRGSFPEQCGSDKDMPGERTTHAQISAPTTNNSSSVLLDLIASGLARTVASHDRSSGKKTAQSMRGRGYNQNIFSSIIIVRFCLIFIARACTLAPLEHDASQHYHHTPVISLSA